MFKKPIKPMGKRKSATKGRARTFKNKKRESKTRHKPFTPWDWTAGLDYNQRRLFDLLARTGMRLREATSLRWPAVDLVRGRIEITGKRGRWRVLPLTGAPEGEVAPGL